MCLKNISKIKTAEHNISVFKVVTVMQDDSLCTPFQGIPVHIGGKYTSKLIVDVGHEIMYGYVHKIPVINVGLHSFPDIESARSMRYRVSSNSRIVKCVIPKGSKYYIGTFEKVDSIASDTIIYVEFVNEEAICV